MTNCYAPRGQDTHHTFRIEQRAQYVLEKICCFFLQGPSWYKPHHAGFSEAGPQQLWAESVVLLYYGPVDAQGRSEKGQHHRECLCHKELRDLTSALKQPGPHLPSAERPTKGIHCGPSDSDLPGTKPHPAFTGTCAPSLITRSLPCLAVSLESSGLSQARPCPGWRCAPLIWGQHGFASERQVKETAFSEPRRHRPSLLLHEEMTCAYSFAIPSQKSQLQKTLSLP